MLAESKICNCAERSLSLIETLRYEPKIGLIRQEMHLARLESSADTFDFIYDQAALQSALKKALEGETNVQRVRIELFDSGRFDITKSDFSKLSPQTSWRLAVAQSCIDSGNFLVFHKTSRRGIYEQARLEFARDAIDEVLLCNELGQLCEGTITSLFVQFEKNGRLYTPPLRCGLLNGVFRQDLLVKGIAEERVLTPEDLAKAEQLYVGNSLRELIPCTLDHKTIISSQQ